MAHPFYIVAIFVLSVGYAQLGVLRRIIGKRIVFLKDVAETVAFASLGSLGASKAFNMLSSSAETGLVAMAHLWILVATLGAVSAAFGSIIRDGLINEFPSALRPGVGSLESLFIGSGVLAALRMAEVPQAWALLAGFLHHHVHQGLGGRGLLPGREGKKAS